MFKGIKIENFKNLTVDLKNLSRINLIIGPNNSGKTNLLTSLSFMKNVVADIDSNNSFSNVINLLGGFHTVNRNNDSDEVSFRFDMRWFKECVEIKNLTTYEISYEYKHDYFMPKITKELYYYTEKFAEQYDEPFYIFNCHTENPGSGLFTYYVDRTRREPITVSQNESTINQITKSGPILNNMRYKNGIDNVVELKNFFRNSNFFSMAKFINVTHSYVLQKSQLDLSKLKNDGSNFIDCLYRICVIEDGEGRRKIEMLLERIFNSRDVKINFIDKDEVCLLEFRIKNKNGVDIMRIDEVSDGTMKLLYMALMLIDNKFNEDKFGVLAIDEPETSLHPAWIAVFGNWILENDFSKQIFISTHSPELLDVFTDSFLNNQVSVIIMQPNGYIENLECEMVSDPIINGFGLGDLYRSNSDFLGGWPWEK
jgi:predicted ATPase